MINKLSIEQIEYANVLHDFCQKELAPQVEQVEQQGYVSKKTIQKLNRIGYNGLNHPEKYGGSGATIKDSLLAQEVISQYYGSTFFSVGASIGLFGLPIKYFGTDTQKELFLPKLISGELTACLGITKPGAGSDVSSITCKAKQTEDGFLLSGQKTYITNAPIADYGLILAVLYNNENKKTGATHFIVDLALEGVSKGKAMQKMGLHGSPTGELFFENDKIQFICEF